MLSTFPCFHTIIWSLLISPRQPDVCALDTSSGQKRSCLGFISNRCCYWRQKCTFGALNECKIPSNCCSTVTIVKRKTEIKIEKHLVAILRMQWCMISTCVARSVYIHKKTGQKHERNYLFHSKVLLLSFTFLIVYANIQFLSFLCHKWCSQRFKCMLLLVLIWSVQCIQDILCFSVGNQAHDLAVAGAVLYCLSYRNNKRCSRSTKMNAKLLITILNIYKVLEPKKLKLLLIL